ncbi:RNA-binding S4 domain-containing protein [Rhodovibrionaceae bacterium A322]
MAGFISPFPNSTPAAMTAKADPNAPQDWLRVDKWLFFARFCKSRALASKLCDSGNLRISNASVVKPHYKLRVGDVLTFPLGPYIRVIEVVALGKRRGPAPEARALYNDLNPIEDQKPLPKDPLKEGATLAREAGSGRPTKKDRRAIDKLQDH